MASSPNCRNTRKTVLNGRSNPGDRRKIKNYGFPDSRGRESTQKPESGNSETTKTSAVLYSSGKASGGSSSYFNSDKNDFHKASASRYSSSFPCNNTFHHKNKPRQFQDHRTNFKNAHKEYSSYNFKPQIGSPEKPTVFFNQQDSYYSREQVMHPCQNEKISPPIRAPEPRSSNLLDCDENVPHTQGNHSTKRNYYNPYEREMFESYVNQPYHKDGSGLFYKEVEDLPPRFKKQVLGGFKVLEQMKREIELHSEKCGNLKPTTMSVNTCIVTEVPDDHQQCAINEGMQLFQQNEMLEKSDVGLLMKNQAHEGRQSGAPYIDCSQSRNNRKNEGNSKHNNDGQSYHTKQTDIHSQRDMNKASFGCHSWKGSAPQNVSNRNDCKESNTYGVTVSPVKRANTVPAFKNYERQFSTDSAVTPRDEDSQNNQKSDVPLIKNQAPEGCQSGAPYRNCSPSQKSRRSEGNSKHKNDAHEGRQSGSPSRNNWKSEGNSKHNNDGQSYHTKQTDFHSQRDMNKATFGCHSWKGSAQQNVSNRNDCKESNTYGVTVSPVKRTNTVPAFKNCERQFSTDSAVTPHDDDSQHNQKSDVGPLMKNQEPEGCQSSAPYRNCSPSQMNRRSEGNSKHNNGAHEGRQSGATYTNCSPSRNNRRSEGNSKHNNDGQSYPRKQTDIHSLSDMNKASFGCYSWKGSAQQNVSNRNDCIESNTHRVTVPPVKRANALPPVYKNCERQFSSDSAVTPPSEDFQNNRMKQASANSEQHTDYQSEGCNRILHPRGKCSSAKRHGKDNLGTCLKENPEHFDYKTPYEHTRKITSPSTLTKSDLEVQKKSVKNDSFSSRSFSNSQNVNQANSRRDLVRQGSNSSFQTSGTNSNESNTQNSTAQKPGEPISLSHDSQLSLSNEQCSSNINFRKNLVKIKVSGDVANLDYWENFLKTKTDIPHFKFEVSVDSTIAQMLSVTFLNKNDAKKAWYTLRKIKGKNDGSPYIKTVNPPRFNFDKNCINTIMKILNGCLRDIDKLYSRVMSSHKNKITAAKKELENERANRVDFSVAHEKLKELEEMQDVFVRYTDVKKKQMNDEVKKTEMDSVIVSHKLLQMKKDFIQEYIFFKGGLPIYVKKELIVDLVLQNQVSVLVAETGSGKSTQLVQYLLQNGVGTNGVIVCTQPRKIAAISIARYVSGQIGSPVGTTVGYEVGLDKKTGKKTKIIYMTDHVLLKKCVNNGNLEGISCVVVDEAHERSLFTDLLLGIMKKCLSNRPDIRIVITSATIHPGVFQEYFNLSSKAILAVPGRTYPVEVKWQEADAYVGWDYLKYCVKLVCKVLEESNFGDILVFLTSPHETDEAVNLFKQTYPNKHDKAFPMLFSLHGKQDTDDQMKIFNPTPKGYRKIIFATNAAETSVTVPGIKFVIDSGMVKEKQYIAERNRSALVVTFISKSSAEQRKGRAGRTQPGICYRMYSKQNYDKDMPERGAPEILRTNLQLALLRILEFKIQPEDFEFVEAPSKDSIISAMHSLEFMGAVKDKYFTDLGRQITKLPLEPQLGKLVILGAKENVGYEASIIASIATISGMVFYRNEDNKVTADKKKMQFCKEEGDFLTFLNVFKQWYYTPRELRPDWCAKNYISAKAMKIAYQVTEEIIKTLRYELRTHVRKGFKHPDLFNSKCEQIFFECFSENVCVFSGHTKTGYFSPFEPGSFFVHPSSSLYYLDSKFPNFLVFSSVLKTSRTFLLNVTPIQESTIISAYQRGVFPYQIDLLKQLQMLPARIYPVGESILIREILGKQGYKLHEIKQQIKAFAKTDAFRIDVNVEKGEILIYIERQHHGIVYKLMNSVIQETQCRMDKEEEIFRIADCASSCFAVSSGGMVNDILLPGEFREVIVESYHKSLSVDKIVSTLKNYGALQSFQEIEEHSNLQILATYVKAIDAQRAVEHLQKLKLFDISSKVSYAKLSDKSLPLFRLQVTWPRFPCLGTGWISFQTHVDCIEASGILTSKSFYIGDHYVLFTPAKTNGKELQMKNLPSFVDPQDVMSALKTHLPDYIEVQNVNLVRAKYYNASEKEVISIKKQLHQLFSQYTPSSKLVINLVSPNAHEVSWVALVYFENFADGEMALEHLKGKAKLGEHKLHIKSVLKSSLCCELQIYKMVEKNIHILMTYSKQEGICTEFDVKPCPAKESVLITFSCCDIKYLNKVLQEVRKLVLGTTLPCSDQAMYSKLFSKIGGDFLKSVQQSTQTMITTNSLRKTITIFGPEKAISLAKSEITCYLSASNDGESVRVFNLSGRKIPIGFIKVLRLKFGFKLLGLIEKFNLRAADIDFVNRKLIVKCSERTMQTVEQCLSELCVEVKASNARNQSSDQESCPVCMDTISSDLYRLNHCGHAFCRQCLLLQMESKIIPLVCAKEGCEKLIFVEDINQLLLGNEELKKEFSQTALKNFIAKSNSVRYCPVPDCSMVYRVPSPVDEFHCPACENDICTKCHAFYHHGMTCDMFQKCKADADYPLKLWMQEDPKNRKLCPKCSAAIEKVTGCPHVLCTQCDTHLCWVCLRTFSRSEDVYDHIPLCRHPSV